MKLIDVTLRESVYYGKGVSNEEGLAYLNKLKESVSNKWIHWVEIGYLNNDSEEPLNYSKEYFLRAAEICKGTFKLSAMMHLPKSDITKWDAEVVSKLDLVRIVVGHSIPEKMHEYVQYFHRLGVKVSANITYAADLNNEEILREIERGKAMELDYFYCADSSGSFSTNTVSRISELMSRCCGRMEPGLHLHDHLQMSLANALEAKKCGLELMDVSVTGAGKGGGNLKMEQAILALNGKEANTMETLNGLHDLVCFFSEMINQDSGRFSREMMDFLTGIYRLGLKATEKLEMESQSDAKRYFKLVTEQFTPFEIE